MTSDQFAANRRQLGLTQAQLASHLGMTKQAVSRIERGERQPTNQQAAAMRLLAELSAYQKKDINQPPATTQLP